MFLPVIAARESLLIRWSTVSVLAVTLLKAYKSMAERSHIYEVSQFPSLGEGLGVGRSQFPSLGEGLGVGRFQSPSLGEGLGVGSFFSPRV